jgi:hypothetical protein
VHLGISRFRSFTRGPARRQYVHAWLKTGDTVALFQPGNEVGSSLPEKLIELASPVNPVKISLSS